MTNAYIAVLLTSIAVMVVLVSGIASLLTGASVSLDIIEMGANSTFPEYTP